MYPYLKNGDKVFVYTYAYIFNNPKIHDVIIVKNPEISEMKKYIIKRIIQINDNQVYIEGDNKSKSYDSRQYGWIDKKMLVGKMLTKL